MAINHLSRRPNLCSTLRTVHLGAGERHCPFYKLRTIYDAMSEWMQQEVQVDK